MKYLWTLILFMGLSISAMADIKILKDGDTLLAGENAIVVIKNTIDLGWNNKTVLVEAKRDFVMEGNKVEYGEFFTSGSLKLLRAATKMMRPSQSLPWDRSSDNNRVVRPSDGSSVKHNFFRAVGPNTYDFFIFGERILTEARWLELGGIADVFEAPPALSKKCFSYEKIDHPYAADKDISHFSVILPTEDIQPDTDLDFIRVESDEYTIFRSANGYQLTMYGLNTYENPNSGRCRIELLTPSETIYIVNVSYQAYGSYHETLLTRPGFDDRIKGMFLYNYATN